MRTIYWHLDVGYPQVDVSGEVEVDDNATEDEIEAVVKEDMWNVVSLSFSDEKPKGLRR